MFAMACWIAFGHFYEQPDCTWSASKFGQNNIWLIVAGAFAAMLSILIAMVVSGNSIWFRSLLRDDAQHFVYITSQNCEEQRKAAMAELSEIEDQIKKRVGTELHDGPMQLLSFVLLRLDAIEDMLKTDPSLWKVADRTVHELREAAAEALKEIRLIAAGLFLPRLDGTDEVNDVLRFVIQNHERRTASKVTYKATCIPLRQPPNVVQCVGRVTQEALSNAYRHAGGEGQEVTATVDSGILRLCILDSGPGIPPSYSGESGLERLGIAGMRYRVQSIGGTFQIRQRSTKGTEVSCEIPLYNVT
jgi:signal transduction histidine kinase